MMNGLGQGGEEGKKGRIPPGKSYVSFEQGTASHVAGDSHPSFHPRHDFLPRQLGYPGSALTNAIGLPTRFVLCLE